MKEIASLDASGQQASSVAVIGDVVGSREHASRRALQEHLVDVLAAVNERVPARQRLEPTIGDEFQAVYGSTGDALLAVLLVRLSLTGGLDARFGLGVGTLEIVGESAYGLTQDGPAWWAARAAVEQAEARQRKVPALRTWVLGSDGTEDDMGLVNAYALCRDQLVTAFDDRERRIALGVLDGLTLTAIAENEGISTSAVSQRFRGGIGALVASVEEMPR